MDRREGDTGLRLSRGQFLKGAGAAAGGVLLAGATGWEPAWAGGGDGPGGRGGRGQPKPIPGGVDANFVPVAANPMWHFSFPGVGFEMATITDFHGVVGASEVQGTATGSDGKTYGFDCDMRFMKGTYVDDRGRTRRGSFGFV
jgi:hypothetical protein